MAIGVKNRQKALERFLEEYRTSSRVIKPKKVGISKKLLNFYRSEARIRTIERATRTKDKIQAEYIARRLIW